MRRDTYLMVKTTAEEKAAVEELAKKNGMNVSAFVRWVILYKNKEE